MFRHDIGSEPIVRQIIENWIASSDAQENDIENWCNDDNREESRCVSDSIKYKISKIKRIKCKFIASSASTADEDRLNNHMNNQIESEENSLLYHSVNGSKNSSTTPEVQRLIDEPESVATLLLEIKGNSKSIDKPTITNKRMTRKTHSNLPNGHFFERSDEVLVENDVEEEQNQNVSEHMQHVNENRVANSDTASASNIFELGHGLYEAMTNGVGCRTDSFNSFNDTEIEYERPASIEEYNGESNNCSYHCRRAVSEDGNQQTWRVSSHVNSRRMQTDLQSNYVETHFGDLSHQQSNLDCYADDDDPYNSFYQMQVDEDDDNIPIDYSIRNFISPAAGLRFGFEESTQPRRYFPLPERFNVDERQLNGDISVPRIPAPRIPGTESAFERLPFSKNSVPQVGPLPAQNPDLSRYGDIREHTTNGVPESTSGTLFTTVPAHSQTQAVHNIAEDRACRLIEECNQMISTSILNMNTMSLLNMNMMLNFLSQIWLSPNQRNSPNCTRQTESTINHQEATTHSADTQTGNDSDETGKTNSARIMQKRCSKRILEMERKKENSLRGVDKTVVAPKPKLMKKPKQSEVGSDFEVESIQSESVTDGWVDVAPRKLMYGPNRFKCCETPKRLSKYMRRSLLKTLNNLK